MNIQLKFTDPGYVSAATEKEELVILLTDFRDPDDNLIVEYQEIRKELPNQVDANIAASMNAAGSTAAAGVGGSFSFNFILNLIMSTSMNQMLSSIKNLQLVVHLILFGFVVPGVTAIFFGALADMITFDPFDGASEYT